MIKIVVHSKISYLEKYYKKSINIIRYPITEFNIKKDFTFSKEDSKPGHICMVMIFRNDVFEVLRAESKVERCGIDSQNTFICI